MLLPSPPIYWIYSRTRNVLWQKWREKKLFGKYLVCAKWKLESGICRVRKISCQVKIVFWSPRCFFFLVITEDPRERKSPPSHYPLTLSHSRHSSLPVSALGLGSLSCSGLSGKLLHQTRVSSPGCHLTVCFSRAALQYFKRLTVSLYGEL